MAVRLQLLVEQCVYKILAGEFSWCKSQENCRRVQAGEGTCIPPLVSQLPHPAPVLLAAAEVLWTHVQLLHCFALAAAA